MTEITSLDDPRVQVFASLTEAQLRNRLEPEKGMFICESQKVIRVALDAGYEPLALLCEQRHILGDAADIIQHLNTLHTSDGSVADGSSIPSSDGSVADGSSIPASEGSVADGSSVCDDFPVFTGSRELLAQLTGYTLTRGVLCAMRRPAPRAVEDICRDARRVAVIEAVTDTTNIGAIFRSAAALGIDAVLLTTNSCDPLNRRAVRVSMGSVFLVPWTWVETADYQNVLRRLGFRTAAMALTSDSVSIDDPVLLQEPRLAIILGTEGDGLPQNSITAADYVVRIPMAHGVDSLNVAAASAVAFWQLRSQQTAPIDK